MVGLPLYWLPSSMLDGSQYSGSPTIHRKLTNPLCPKRTPFERILYESHVHLGGIQSGRNNVVRHTIVLEFPVLKDHVLHRRKAEGLKRAAFKLA